MKKELKRKVDLFLQNKKKIKNIFKYESEANCLLSSFLYTDLDKEVDAKKLIESHELVVDKTNIFSDYRFISMILASKMAMTKNPLKYFNRVDEYKEILKKKKKFDNLINIFTSLILSDCEENINVDKYIEKEIKIFNLMNDKHPFLTDDEDAPFAMLLALSNKKEKRIDTEVEECYQILRRNIKHAKNACQSMACVLTISDKSVKEKTDKIIDIYNKIKVQKKHIEDNFVLMVLATLIFVDRDSKEIVDDIIEVDKYIGSKKGSGLWPFGRATRLMFAILLVESVYGDEAYKNTKNTIAVSSIIVEEIITLILVSNLLLIID